MYEQNYIIINGEVLGNSVVNNRYFGEIYELSPLVIKQFIAAINNTDFLDKPVRIKNYTTDNNSINISFKNRVSFGNVLFTYSKDAENNFVLKSYTLNIISGEWKDYSFTYNYPIESEIQPEFEDKSIVDEEKTEPAEVTLEIADEMVEEKQDIVNEPQADSVTEEPVIAECDLNQDCDTKDAAPNTVEDTVAEEQDNKSVEEPKPEKMFSLFSDNTTYSQLASRIEAAEKLKNVEPSEITSEDNNVQHCEYTKQANEYQDLKTQQYPTQQYPTQQYPTQQYPTQQYPTQQYPTQQYPTQQYPTQQYPTQQYPTQQYPTQQCSAPQNNNTSDFSNTNNPIEHKIQTPTNITTSNYDLQVEYTNENKQQETPLRYEHNEYPEQINNLEEPAKITEVKKQEEVKQQHVEESKVENTEALVALDTQEAIITDKTDNTILSEANIDKHEDIQPVDRTETSALLTDDEINTQESACQIQKESEEIFQPYRQAYDLSKLNVYEDLSEKPDSIIIDFFNTIPKFESELSALDTLYNVQYNYEEFDELIPKEDIQELNDDLSKKLLSYSNKQINKDKKMSIYQNNLTGYDYQMAEEKINKLKQKIKELQKDQDVTNEDVLDAQIELLLNNKAKSFRILDHSKSNTVLQGNDVLQIYDDLFMSKDKVYRWGDMLILDE